ELQRLGPGHVKDEDFAVADAAGAGDAGDALGDLGGALVADANADLDLGQEGHAVFAADVAVEVALLPAVALGLAHDAGRHAQLGDGLQDRFGPERLDDDGELLHAAIVTHPRRAGKDKGQKT